MNSGPEIKVNFIDMISHYAANQHRAKRKQIASFAKDKIG